MCHGRLTGLRSVLDHPLEDSPKQAADAKRFVRVIVGQQAQRKGVDTPDGRLRNTFLSVPQRGTLHSARSVYCPKLVAHALEIVDQVRIESWGHQPDNPSLRLQEANTSKSTQIGAQNGLVVAIRGCWNFSGLTLLLPSVVTMRPVYPPCRDVTHDSTFGRGSGPVATYGYHREQRGPRRSQYRLTYLESPELLLAGERSPLQAGGVFLG